jgi:hypothetical protein
LTFAVGAPCVDLLDGEAFGLDRTGFGNRHRAGRRVQLADRHGGIGHRETRRVDLRGRRPLRERHARQTERGQRRRGEAAQQAPAQRRRRLRRSGSCICCLESGCGVFESIVYGHLVLLV